MHPHIPPVALILATLVSILFMKVFTIINHVVLVNQDPPDAFIQTLSITLTMLCVKTTMDLALMLLTQNCINYLGFDGSPSCACAVCLKDGY